MPFRSTISRSIRTTRLPSVKSLYPIYGHLNMVVDLSTWLSDNPLGESIVLSLEYDAPSRAVSLVYRYAAEELSRSFQRLPSTGLQDYRKLKLTGVRRVHVTSFQNDPPVAALADLQEEITTRTICAIGTQTKRTRGVNILEIELMNCFELIVEYAEADVEIKIAKVVPDGHGSWKYLEPATGEEFNTRDPFAKLN